MPYISANDLKIKGVSAIEAMLATQPEAIISVRGKERFAAASAIGAPLRFALGFDQPFLSHYPRVSA